jgi:hypothetical protein
MLRFGQIVSIGIVLLFSCGVSFANNRDLASQNEIRIGDRLGEEVLRYRNYRLKKRTRKVECDWPTEEPCSIDVSYAVLQRAGKTVGRFDADVYFGPGNSVQFGLISMLGGAAKQAVISQDIFRGGNQWIVGLGRRPRVLYDGDTWATGREVDDMSVIDLNKDGIFEIVVPTCIFYGFESLSPAATPLPSIVFKYSKRSRKFSPANPQFANYVLDGIEKRKRVIHPVGGPPDNMNHLGDVLGVVLDYVFAGRAREAWAFFDHAYKLPNKNRIKKEIRAELRQSPVYRFIYRERIKRK